MDIETAKVQMTEKMHSHAKKFISLGFRADVRVYFTDKSLFEHEELHSGCDTLWCELKISSPDMQEGHGLIYELYADIDKNGTDIKTYKAKNTGEIDSALEELYLSLSESDNPIQLFTQKYEEAVIDFDEQMRLFDLRMKRIKYISFGAFSVVLLISLIIFILSLF